jgi:hypothetical protein
MWVKKSQACAWSGYADEREIHLLLWIESKSSILHLIAKGVLIPAEPH